jgi:hypothetical protein
MSLKSLQIMAVLLMYSPVLVIGNAHATICMPEQGKLQLEFGVVVCDLAPADTTSSTPDRDCGNCTDSKIKIGETRRVALCNNSNLFPVQVTFACQLKMQHILPAATHFEPNASASSLIGSSILII